MKKLLLLIVSLSVPMSLAAECDCDQMVATMLPCYELGWKQLDASPKSVEDLEVYLGALLEGTDDSIVCVEQADGFRGWDYYDGDCGYECVGDTWAAYHERALDAPSAAVQRGASAVVFATYMDDASPPSDVLTKLQGLASALLDGDDPTTQALALRMLQFYNFKTALLLDRELALLESPSPLVRELSFRVFKKASGATLAFSPTAGDKKRTEQLTKLNSWWETEGRDQLTSP
jgi:hypothetical protein